ncbi:predicted protein [Nematostella vectensis]|uniref:GAIN-B domain-containing protein n=1 Tax=Nematostella vectensis TaxID=45351 RepID=A7RVX5_NEMVE|nr:predicted protein [Nematostella vectensis]|eukprot:XP_001636376.1 predicted protein [Nematostella vectensis]
MSSNQAILPYIDKNACLVQQHGKGMSRRRAIEQRIEKRRSEIRPHCSSASSSKSDFEDDRKLSPLVKYQVQRSICSAMDLSPRHQEAKVDEWLQKNRIKVRHKLPRLDPLTLTSRGVDMEKYINFIYPPPMCLKLRNGIPPRQRRPSYEEVIAEPKEPCPRLLRALHGKEHSLVLNPVVRVGGGYKRLTWKTAEVLPGIGQRPQDVTSAFTCATCGVNMAVSQEIMDGDGVMRVVVTYPSNCASCGKYVNARRRNMLEERALDYGVPAHESVKQTIYRGNPGQVFDHRRFGNKDQDKKRRERRQRKDDEDYETEVDWRNDMDSFREHMSRADSVSDDNENDPDSVERNGDGFFITEPGIEVIGLEKPSSAPEVRSAWDDGSNSAHVTRGYDSDTRPSHDEVIVEHRDPESGIRIRVRKKERGGKEYDTRDKRSHRGRKWRDERGNTSRDQRDEGLSDDGKLRDDDDSKWRDYQSQGSQGGDGQGLRDEEDIQYEGGREGRDKHYSKLHARRKRHAKRHRRHDINGSATAIEGVSSDESSSYEFIIYQSSGDIRHRTRSSDIRRENARVVKSDGEIHDMERWYRAMKARHNTKRRRTFPKSHTMYPPSAGSDSDYLDEVQLQRKLTATFAAQSSRDGQTLLKADDMAERPHNPGYIADSEEDQLKMLQAQLRRMHRQSRKRSGSGRHRQHNDLPRSQTREERQHTDLPRSQTRKERRKGTGKSTKVDVSLEERGSSSDSWDSEESLHVRPLSEQFYDSASDTSPLPRKLRSATLDDRQLPSRRATHHGRRTSQRSMDGSAHAQGDEDEAKNDGNGETSEKPGNTKNKYKRREYSKKTVTNQDQQSYTRLDSATEKCFIRDVLLQKVFKPKHARDFEFNYTNTINELTIQANIPWQNIDNGAVILAVVFKNFKRTLHSTSSIDSSPSYSGSWSTDGCTAVSSDNHAMTCSCNHLTNFAILMQVTPKPPAVCVTAAAMLQLFLMAALFWMLLEGIQLYLQLVRVYNADMNLKLCYIFAWDQRQHIFSHPKGVVQHEPETAKSSGKLLHSAHNLTIKKHKQLKAKPEYCFPNVEEQGQPREPKTSRRNLKACLVLFPILGITWSIGFVNMLDAGVVTMYLFTILNSTQGLLIFILHCALNLEMRAAFRRKLCRESQVKDFSSSHSHKKTQGQSSIPTPSKTKGVELQLEDVDTGDLPDTNNTY